MSCYQSAVNMTQEKTSVLNSKICMCYRSNLISDKFWLNLVSWFSITLVWSYSLGTKDIEKKIGLKKYYFNLKPHLTSNTYYTKSQYQTLQ